MRNKKSNTNKLMIDAILAMIDPTRFFIAP